MALTLSERNLRRAELLNEAADLTPEELTLLSPQERATLAREIRAEERWNEHVLDVVPRLSPEFSRPVHLAPLAEFFERARRGEPVRACCFAPPRHGKTELVMHGLVQWLDLRPTDTVAYLGYGAQFAQSKGRRARDLAGANGWQPHPKFDTSAEWRNAQFGGCVVSGVNGPVLGKGFNLAVIDDPHKDRLDAESPVMRDRVYDWFKGTVLQRMEPSGAVLVTHQRWVEDDLIGRLLNESGWEYIELPAVNPITGAPLWPERWPLIELEAHRLNNEYNWASQYIGKPRPKGGKVFSGEPARYDQPAITGRQIVLALDPAGTDNTWSDHSAACALAVEGFGHKQVADILEVERWRALPDKVAPELVAFVERHGNGLLHIEGSRDGHAIAKALHEIDPKLRFAFVAPRGDKFTRATSCASAWNQSRVRVPRDGCAPWLKPFLYEISRFTGLGDREDDQVDCVVHAWNAASDRRKPTRTGSSEGRAWE